MSASSHGEAVAHLYEVFAHYRSPGESFCTFCHSPEEIRAITQTPVALLDVEQGRALLWETADHWESAEVYRHYLPRLLELLGPPWRVEDLYPLHLFETLVALGFRNWPEREQEAVVEYLERPQMQGGLDDEDRQDWAAGLARLKGRKKL